MKIPKAPKALPKKLPVRAQPFNARLPKAPPSPPPKPVKAAPPPKPLKFKAPESRHFVERLSEEELKSAQHKAKIWRWRSKPSMMMGGAVFGMGLYTTQLWISVNKDAPAEELPDDLIDRFDKQATGYDEKVNTAELLTRMNARRKAITQKARGHVLEVAVGTGRNSSYYPIKKCDTITLLDASKPMLAVAQRKWKEDQPDYFHRILFKHQSALDPITPPFGAQDGYDTVLQTMGLCSTPQPVQLLRNLETATKEDGQILLLEHGKSHYEWLNKILDKTAPAHANEHGCWWNKDIGKIVEESGLEVVEIKRYNFGTTWWVELKPRKGMRSSRADANKAAVEAALVAARDHGDTPELPVAPKPWWNLWV